MSRIDLTPAETTAMGVLPSAVKSALMSRPGGMMEPDVKPSHNWLQWFPRGTSCPNITFLTRGAVPQLHLISS